jgi:hypothetical protein
MFVVRYVEDKSVVGFFTVPNINWLGTAIDEITDPGICEYAEIEEEFNIVFSPYCQLAQYGISPEGTDDDPHYNFMFDGFYPSDTSTHIIDQLINDMRGRPVDDPPLEFFSMNLCGIMEWDYEGEPG